MKTLQLKKLKMFTVLLIVLTSFTMTAQIGGWKPELVENSQKALEKMIEQKQKLQTFKDQSYGYAVFPKVTKGAIGIGGAGGKGAVFKNHVATGESTLKQATIGFQFGGQQYVEIIFFEDKKAYDKFTNKKVKFDGQASAVAIKAGVSVDVTFKNGMAIFTQTKGGLMYEASVGGQHFSFKPK